jgi:Do/DeqQ family serine protease
MNTKLQFFVIAFVCVLIGTILSPIVFTGYNQKKEIDLVADSTNPPIKDSQTISQAVALEKAFEEVFNVVSPSVVSIATEKTIRYKNSPQLEPFFEHYYGLPNRGGEFKQKQRGLGSGIILNSEGYILTNEHVVAGWDKLTVKLKNKKVYEATLVGTDKIMDLSLLKIEGSADLKPVSLGDSNKVKVGNWSIAIGAPHGFEHSFTIGVVSAIARGGIDSSGLGYIQTDAAINQGNSGGPLLNIRGEVIGINRMIVSPSGGSIGIGFAIPINDAKRIINELKTNGKVKHTWLGIHIEQITEDVANELKLTNQKGAIIREVTPDSPADKAGLKVKDIILKAGDRDIETREDLIEEVLKTKIGKKIDLKILRKGSSLNIPVITGER